MKTSLLISFAASIFILAACAKGPVGNENVPEPVKAVDLDRYLGLWYEIGRYENRFEKGCEAVTAEYKKREDGLIQVINTCRHDSVDGEVEIAEGRAKVVEGSDNAKLKVSFFGPFYLGNYWVLDHAEDYRWSIVGEPSGRYLWILARAPLTGDEKTFLWQRAKELGYDINLLRDVKHR